MLLHAAYYYYYGKFISYPLHTFKSNHLYEYSSLTISFETMHGARIKRSTPKRPHFHFQMIIANLGKS